MSWTVSNSQTGKTGVTYSWAFTTATAATLTAVTLTVPTGTAGTPAVGSVYGVGAGTVALAGTTITYTITTPAAIAANIPIYLSFTGLTNTTTANSYTSLITTQKSGPSTVDTGTTSSVTFGSSSTTASVTVGQTLTFTNNLSAFSMSVDPTSLNNTQSQAVVLTVQTNAASGYSLAASDTGLSRSAPAFTIPAVSSGPTVGVSTFPTSGWGADRGAHHRRYRRGHARIGTLGREVRRLSEHTGQLPDCDRSHRGDTGHVDSDEPGCRRLHRARRQLHRHHHVRRDAQLLGSRIMRRPRRTTALR